MNSRSVSAVTIGYMGYAVPLWVFGVFDAGWLHGAAPIVVEGAVIGPVAILLLVVGILSFTTERVLDTVIFLGGSAFFSAIIVVLRDTHDLVPGFFGWFLIVWVAFFAYLFLAALNADLWRKLFLVGMWLGQLAFAIQSWSAIYVIGIIGGYINLATAMFACIVSASEIYSHSVHLKEKSSVEGSMYARGSAPD